MGEMPFGATKERTVKLDDTGGLFKEVFLAFVLFCFIFFNFGVYLGSCEAESNATPTLEQCYQLTDNHEELKACQGRWKGSDCAELYQEEK